MPDMKQFTKAYQSILGEANPPVTKLINSKPDNENANRAIARSLRVFYTFYFGVAYGNHTLTPAISKSIVSKLNHVNDIVNDDILAEACKDTMMRVSGVTAKGYSKELHFYSHSTQDDIKQCYKDVQSLMPLYELD